MNTIDERKQMLKAQRKLEQALANLKDGTLDGARVAREQAEFALAALARLDNVPERLRKLDPERYWGSAGEEGSNEDPTRALATWLFDQTGLRWFYGLPEHGWTDADHERLREARTRMARIVGAARTVKAVAAYERGHHDT